MNNRLEHKVRMIRGGFASINAISNSIEANEITDRTWIAFGSLKVYTFQISLLHNRWNHANIETVYRMLLWIEAEKPETSQEPYIKEGKQALIILENFFKRQRDSEGKAS